MIQIPVFLLTASGSLSGECQACHANETAKHAMSAHANALKPISQSQFLAALPGRPLGEARGGYLLSFETQGANLTVTASHGRESASGVIEWVFGAGRRAETPLVSRGSAYLEHRISYYTNGGRFDLTMGHTAGISRSSAAALGRVQPPEVIGRCFACHSSGGLPSNAGFRPGVPCEACHQGAQKHARDGGPVTNPGRLKAAASIAFCGACHRNEPEGDPGDPINARYQPVGLRRSKCFQSGKLSCTTCHDPHANAESDAESYVQRCLACHPGQQGRGNCIACHMPKVTIASRLVFTDHYIR